MEGWSLSQASRIRATPSTSTTTSTPSKPSTLRQLSTPCRSVVTRTPDFAHLITTERSETCACCMCMWQGKFDDIVYFEEHDEEREKIMMKFSEITGQLQAAKDAEKKPPPPPSSVAAAASPAKVRCCCCCDCRCCCCCCSLPVLL